MNTTVVNNYAAFVKSVIMLVTYVLFIIMVFAKYNIWTIFLVVVLSMLLATAAGEIIKNPGASDDKK